MEVETLTSPPAEVLMADSASVEDEMLQDEPTAAEPETQAEEYIIPDDELLVDSGAGEFEVQMGEEDSMLDDELLPVEEEEQRQHFGSPPAALVNEDDTQVSVLGHTAGDELVDVPVAEFVDDSGAGSAPEAAATVHDEPSNTAESGDISLSTKTDDQSQSQSRSLSPSRALATQHQRSSDESKHQDQTIEHPSPDHTRLSQSQDLLPGPDSEPAKQSNEVDVVHERGGEGEEDRVSVTTNQVNEGGLNSTEGGAIQNNTTNIFKQSDDKASCTCAAATIQRRPALLKEALSEVEFEDDYMTDPTQLTTDSALVAPIVLLSYANQTFSLFKQQQQDQEQADAQEDSEPPLPTLFIDQPQHELYYDNIEALFKSLREHFAQEVTEQEELVLSFEAIGIALAEDNLYAREVSLFDFDRIQVGCGLPGRLHLTLEVQQRFATGFNALVEHIALSRGGGAVAAALVEEGEQEHEQAAEGEREEEEQQEGGELYADEGEGEWQEAAEDQTTADEGDEHYEDAAEGEEEAYNLEEALADLDSDDLEAVLDGAEKDYIESEEAVYHAHDGEHDDEGEEDVLLPAEGNELVDVPQQEETAVEALQTAAAEEALAAEEPLGEVQEATTLELGLEPESVQAQADVEAEIEAAAESLYEEEEHAEPAPEAEAEAEVGVDELVEEDEPSGEDLSRSITETLEGDADEFADELEPQPEPSEEVLDYGQSVEQAEAQVEKDEGLLDDALLSPKRARDENELVDVGAGEVIEGETKRARLDEDTLTLDE